MTVATTELPAQAESSATGRILWPDVMRIVAMVAVFAFHYIGARPSSAGPLTSGAIRGAGGPFAISIFIMLGGFTFALADSKKSKRPYIKTLGSRFRRLLVPYWIVAVPFITGAVVTGEMPASELWKAAFWLTGLNILHPAVYLPVSEAWWYVTLVLQMALFAPLLPRLREAFGRVGLCVAALLVNYLTVRLIVGLPPEWVYLAQGLVLARLAEVTIGYVVGDALFGRHEGGLDLSTLALVGLLAAGGALMGSAGMMWTPPLALVVVAASIALCARIFGLSMGAGRVSTTIASVAAMSYCFYLSHTPVVRMVVRIAQPHSTATVLAWLPVALAASAAVGWGFDRLSAAALGRPPKERSHATNERSSQRR